MDIEYSENTLTANEYLLLEQLMGELLTTKEQAERAIYWYINDVWVLPQYQGKGIGKNMAERIIQYVKDASIPGTSVLLSLMCAKSKEGYYEKMEFLKHPHE